MSLEESPFRFGRRQLSRFLMINYHGNHVKSWKSQRLTQIMLPRSIKTPLPWKAIEFVRLRGIVHRLILDREVTQLEEIAKIGTRLKKEFRWLQQVHHQLHVEIEAVEETTENASIRVVTTNVLKDALEAQSSNAEDETRHHYSVL